MNKTADEPYQIRPIGYVQRSGDDIRLKILAEYRPALRKLDHFSHVIVIWWGNRCDDENSRNNLQIRPPYAEQVQTGVFATRAEFRPNPVEVTTCKILAVDEQDGVVRIGNIDAYDGSPVLDLKAYFPVCDRVKDATIPDWLEGWPGWMPDEGIGLWEGEDEAGPR